MNHYYNNNTDLKSNITEFEYTYWKKRLKFKSDNGVFSKDRVDFGSNVLINSLPEFGDIKNILDVGCGVGVIGICLKSRYQDAKVLMVDVNDRAIKLANDNIILNKLDNIECIKSNLYENVNEEYDCIVSNPPIRAGKKIVHGVVIDGFSHLAKGGRIYIVIQKKQGAESMEKKMLEVFGNVKAIEKKNGYYVFESIKN